MNFGLFFYRKVLIHKLKKLKRKNLHWNGDHFYNLAIDDYIHNLWSM